MLYTLAIQSKVKLILFEINPYVSKFEFINKVIYVFENQTLFLNVNIEIIIFYNIW
jgi:hypothetical protein